MEDTNYGSEPAHAVQDETQAKLLSEPKSFRYFSPFLARNCTVSQAAKEAGCNVDIMLYRVKTFLRAGLLKVVHIQERAGRPIKHYRSVHDAYFIPASTTPFVSYEEEARQALRIYEEDIIRELARVRRTLNRQGLRIFRDKLGEVGSHTASSETHAIDYDVLPQFENLPEFQHLTIAEIFSDKLFLTDTEAKVLLSKIYRLWRKSKFESAPPRKPYVLQVALVPLEPS